MYSTAAVVINETILAGIHLAIPDVCDMGDSDGVPVASTGSDEGIGVSGAGVLVGAVGPESSLLIKTNRAVVGRTVEKGEFIEDEVSGDRVGLAVGDRVVSTGEGVLGNATGLPVSTLVGLGSGTRTGEDEGLRVNGAEVGESEGCQVGLRTGD